MNEALEEQPADRSISWIYPWFLRLLRRRIGSSTDVGTKEIRSRWSKRNNPPGAHNPSFIIITTCQLLQLASIFCLFHTTKLSKDLRLLSQSTMKFVLKTRPSFCPRWISSPPLVLAVILLLSLSINDSQALLSSRQTTKGPTSFPATVSPLSQTRTHSREPSSIEQQSSRGEVPKLQNRRTTRLAASTSSSTRASTTSSDKKERIRGSPKRYPSKQQTAHSKKTSINKNQSQGKHNSSKKQQSKNSKQKDAHYEPWKAGYYTSLKTQNLIKRAATSNTNIHLRPTAILQTFLSIAPSRCNAANVVCALTLTANYYRSSTRHRSTQEERTIFRQAFYETVERLQQVIHTAPISARQLCNAAWALAKLCDKDSSLLPETPKQVALSQDSMFGIAEEWHLDDDDKNHLPHHISPIRRDDATVLHTTVDDVAMALTRKLQHNSTNVKNGELCMACWAYGILRERNRPPGWKTRPRLGMVTRSSQEDSGSPPKKKNQNRMRFEQWHDEDSLNENDINDDVEGSVSDILFDEIARALSQPIGIDKLNKLEMNEAQHDTSQSSDSVTATPSSETSIHYIQRIDTCRWSELANVAWAFATHGWSCTESSEELLSNIASETVRRLRRWRDLPASRDIAQLIWSLGIAQSDNFRLADSLIQVVEALRDEWILNGHSQRPLVDWSCADLVQVSLSLAHARLDEQELLQALYQESLRRLPNHQSELEQQSARDHDRKNFHFWEIIILLWSQARLHLTEAQHSSFASFANQAVASIETAAAASGSLKSIGLGAQEKANLAWSLIILEQCQTDVSKKLLSRIFVEASKECDDERCMQLEHAHQMWQALFLLENESPESVAEVPKWFHDYLQSKWQQEKARPKRSSARHRALSRALNHMGVVHRNEHDEDIDVAIILEPNALWTHQALDDGERDADGIRVAVEFDGPNHFTRQNNGSSSPPRSLGHSVLKYRLLKKQGWNVIRVPYFEFDKIPFWSSMERQRYLQRLLKTHSILKFNDVNYSTYEPLNPNRKSRFD